MSSIILVFIFLFQGIVYAQEEAITTTFFKVNQNGTYLPAFHPEVPPPATVISLSSIHSTVGAGSIIKIRRVGGYANAIGAQDDVIWNGIGVFVDSANNMIAPGPNSNAPAVGAGFFEFCNFGVPIDAPNDFLIGNSGTYENGTEFSLEVPNGAVALLVAPQDCPVFDNSDQNNNYGVIISYEPAIRADIYQVVKNPILNPSVSTAVDLVAGKNADIVVTGIPPNMNIEGSTVEWSSGTASQDTTRTFQLKPGQITSTASGDATFYIDPVPTESVFFNKLTEPKVFIRGKNAQGIIEPFADTTLQTRILKTKPIRIGFVPISGCIADNAVETCFEGATTSDAEDMATYGGEIMKAMYPVADNEFSTFVELPQALAVKNKVGQSIDIIQGNADLDLFTLLKYWYSRLTNQNIESFLAGVNNLSYWEYRNNSTVVGQAIVLPTGGINVLKNYAKSLLVRKNYFFTLPHEVGHLLSLFHTCQGITATIPINVDPFEICSEEQNTFDGYINVDMSNPWLLPRGKVGDRHALMRFNTGFSGFIMDQPQPDVRLRNNKWISQAEYLTLFEAQLSQPLRSKKQNTINSNFFVAAEIVENSFKLVSSFKTPVINSSASVTGAYLIQVKDASTNIISSLNTDDFEISESEGKKYIAFNVALPINAMFIDVYKPNASGLNQIGSVVVPSDILEEEVKYIPGKLVNGSGELFKNKLTSLNNKLRDAVKCKSYAYAKNIVTKEISPFIKSNLQVARERTSNLDVDQNDYNNRIVSAIAFLSSANVVSVNPFIDTCVDGGDSINSGEKSILEVRLLKEPLNKNVEYSVKAWFNSEPVKITVNKDQITAASHALNAGNHSWLVKTYSTDKKVTKSLETAKSKYESEIRKLEDQLIDETDPEIRQEIAAKIAANQLRLNQVKAEIEKVTVELSNPVTINFEVI